MNCICVFIFICVFYVYGFNINECFVVGVESWELSHDGHEYNAH